MQKVLRTLAPLLKQRTKGLGSGRMNTSRVRVLVVLLCVQRAGIPGVLHDRRAALDGGGSLHDGLSC